MLGAVREEYSRDIVVLVDKGLVILLMYMIQHRGYAQYQVSKCPSLYIYMRLRIREPRQGLCSRGVHTEFRLDRPETRGSFFYICNRIKLSSISLHVPVHQWRLVVDWVTRACRTLEGCHDPLASGTSWFVTGYHPGTLACRKHGMLVLFIARR